MSQTTTTTAAELGGARAVQPAQRAGAEAKAAGCRLHLGDVDSFSACFLPCKSPIDRHRLVSDVVDGRCTLHARLSTNSCVIGHGNSHHVVRTDSCMGIHANSRGASAHGNSRIERGHEVSRETKTSSMSTLSRVWRPAVGENFPLQQASESLHEEAWVGRVNSGVCGNCVSPSNSRLYYLSTWLW